MEGNVIHHMAQKKRQGIKDVRRIRESTKAVEDLESSKGRKLLPSGAEEREAVLLELCENQNCGEGSGHGSHGGMQLLPGREWTINHDPFLLPHRDFPPVSHIG